MDSSRYYEQYAQPDFKPQFGFPAFYLCGFRDCPFQSYTYQQFFQHVSDFHMCRLCSVYSSYLPHHQCRLVQEGGGQVESAQFFTKVKDTHGGTLVTYMHNFEDDIKEVGEAIKIAELPTKELFRDREKMVDASVGSIVLVIIMSRVQTYTNGFEYTRIARIHFPGPNEDIFSADDVAEFMIKSSERISEEVAQFLLNGSQWVVDRIESIQLQLGELNLFRSSQPGDYIPFPFHLRRKGYANFRDTKGECFELAICASVYWKYVQEQNKTAKKGKKKTMTHPSTWKKFYSKFDFSMLKHGLGIHGNLSVFETKNKVCVNILSYMGERIIVIRKSRFKFEQVAHLFLLYEGPSPRRPKSTHLCVIHDLSKFLASLTPTHKYFICNYCLRKIPSAAGLENHTSLCKENIRLKATVPPAQTFLEFKNHYMRLPYQYVCTYTFQTYSIPVSKTVNTKVQLLYEQKPAGYSICVWKNIGPQPKLVSLENYYGDDCVEHFWEKAGTISQEILTRIRTEKNKIIMTAEQKMHHKAATNCETCGRLFDDTSDGVLKGKIVKVADHCHFTYCESAGSVWNYRQTVCVRCNNRYKYLHEVVFINFSSSVHAFNLILRGLDSMNFPSKNIDIIGKNAREIVQLRVLLANKVIPPLCNEENQNYKHGLRYPRCRFIDANRYFNHSLGDIMSGLTDENHENLGLIRQAHPYLFPDMSKQEYEDNIHLLAKFRSFPHRSLNGPDSLNDAKEIPEAGEFFQDLNEKPCSEEEYQEIREMCRIYKIDTLGKLAKASLGLKSLQLAVAWAEFSRNAFKAYGICPATTCSLSAFAWEAMLKSLTQKIELISDKDMLNMVKVYGGLITSNTKHVESNHSGLPEGINPTKPPAFLMSMDVNALFSEIMCENKFATGDFKWETQEELSKIDFSDPNLDLDRGMILEVNLQYPRDAQLTSVQLPMAPQKIKTCYSLYSKPQKKAMDLHRLNGRRLIFPERLMLTCYDKNNYVLDYRALGFYIRNGLVLKSILRAFSYQQEAFLRPFILKNIERRAEARTESEKALYKQMNNLIWGNCGRNYENNVKVKIIKSKTDALKYLSSSKFVSYEQITSDTSLFCRVASKAVVQRPRHIALAIADLSKIYMYQLVLNTLPSIFQDFRVCTLDVDGGIFCIGMDEKAVWKALSENSHLFDFSLLPINQGFLSSYPHLIDHNKKKKGALKIECLSIKRGLFIKPKNYMLEYYGEGNMQSTKCSGVKKSSISGLTFNKLLESVRNSEAITIHEIQMRAYKDDLYVATSEKAVFNQINFHRIFPKEDDPNYSLPVGHYMLDTFSK